jgi:hypothetical protein
LILVLPFVVFQVRKSKAMRPESMKAGSWTSFGGKGHSSVKPTPALAFSCESGRQTTATKTQKFQTAKSNSLTSAPKTAKRATPTKKTQQKRGNPHANHQNIEEEVPSCDDLLLKDVRTIQMQVPSSGVGCMGVYQMRREDRSYRRTFMFKNTDGKCHSSGGGIFS